VHISGKSKAKYFRKSNTNLVSEMMKPKTSIDSNIHGTPLNRRASPENIIRANQMVKTSKH
jgi:hypothetical protein